MSEKRQRAHELIDLMPEVQLSALVGLLKTIVDPVAAALDNAPIEDEEIGEAEERAAAEAIEWLKHHEPIPNEQVLAEFGLSLDDFERMGRAPLLPEPNGTTR